jgi:hypothetical protein
MACLKVGQWNLFAITKRSTVNNVGPTIQKIIHSNEWVSIPSPDIYFPPHGKQKYFPIGLRLFCLNIEVFYLKKNPKFQIKKYRMTSRKSTERWQQFFSGPLNQSVATTADKVPFSCIKNDKIRTSVHPEIADSRMKRSAVSYRRSA